MSKKQKKKQVKRMLISASSVDSVEEKLALAVVLKAVDDIGNRGDMRRKDASVDSTSSIKQGGLDFWLESVSIDRAYFHRVLKTTGLLRHGLI